MAVWYCHLILCCELLQVMLRAPPLLSRLFLNTNSFFTRLEHMSIRAHACWCPSYLRAPNCRPFLSKIHLDRPHDHQQSAWQARTFTIDDWNVRIQCTLRTCQAAFELSDCTAAFGTASLRLHLHLTTERCCAVQH